MAVVSYHGGRHRLGFQVFEGIVTSGTRTMIADWSSIAQDVTFDTDEHGYGFLTASIPLEVYKSYQVYDALPLAHVVLGDGAFHAFEGRIEDRALVDGGIRITCFGYWRSLYDAPYTALWSSTDYGSWHQAQTVNASANKPEKYGMNNDSQLMMTLAKDEIYKNGEDYAEWFYRVPKLSDRSLVEIDYTYNVLLPTNWEFEVACREYDFTGGSTVAAAKITGNGALQTASVTTTLTASKKLVGFKIHNATGDSWTNGTTGNYRKESVGVERNSRPDLTESYLTLSANNKYATKRVAQSTYTATKMSAYLKGFATGENCVMGIYSDNGGSPDALLDVTGEISGEDRLGIYTGELANGVALASGTTYWLAIIVDNAVDIAQYTSGHVSDTNADNYAGGYADPWGSNSAQTYGMIITAYADEWYAQITDIALRTTASNTVYADEIAKDLVSFISALNSSQLSASTALIDNPNLALTDIRYEDVLPARILTDLVTLGDDSSPVELYEVGVWEDQVLHFRKRGSAGMTWYTDVVSLNIDSTIDSFYNSAYGTYRIPAGFFERTATSTDAASVAKYGVTRRAAVSRNTQSEHGYASAAMATSYRDAYLNDSKDITPRARVICEGIFTASGARVPNYIPRSGDTLVLRNLPPTGSAVVDKIRSFVLARTSYDVDTDTLIPTPEMSIPSLEFLVAQNSAEIKGV